MLENSGLMISENINKLAGIGNKAVLEIGCGTGRISAFLCQKTNRLTAIDPDEKTIENAKKSVARVDFRIGSGEDIEFQNESFDIVIFTLSLHHQNSRKALKEASRVLKEDGSILVIEPLPEGELEQVFAFVNNENDDKEEAKRAVFESGLTISASEEFTARWAFDNKEDLFESVFRYYNIPVDHKIAEDMILFLGDKTNHSPIELTDSMIIYCLKKM